MNLQNRLRLFFRPIQLVDKTEVLGQTLRSTNVASNAAQKFKQRFRFHRRSISATRASAAEGELDQLDYRIDVGQGHGLTFQNVPALTCAAKQIQGAPRDNFCGAAGTLPAFPSD